MEINNNDRKELFFLPEGKGALYELKKNPNDAKEIISFKLTEKKQITSDTYIFVFSLPEEMYLGLNIGNHVAIM